MKFLENFWRETESVSSNVLQVTLWSEMRFDHKPCALHAKASQRLSKHWNVQIPQPIKDDEYVENKNWDFYQTELALHQAV
ncbi:hypothetical protein T4E_3981 [Trichinella pseudospiralis]|uniref:Uncharacterized protein n=1 Tax=Trichinella pseudospiralis TaxID=6337 RepID=A0A0V0XWS4_TRIPS|nr:hypothetical protein T4E_10300 [Trichinella pseudospiralis]KRX86315.1 hypothetical protein T4E_10448 [Trichinella pseudospiralis]KRX92258.1 hypothetical protein T4E_3981 [Trichinella pseudospiralis]